MAAANGSGISDPISLVICGCTMTASLCLVHWLSRSERASHKHAWMDYQQAISSQDTELGDFSDVGKKDERRPKPRAPFLDFLRGLCLSFIVTFHLMWNFREFHMLPHSPPIDKAKGLPIINYVYFAAYFAVAFFLCYVGFLYSPYLCYAIYAPVVTYCLYSMWWESQISGVCLIMMCLGMSQALVHRNGIVWREVFTRAAKLGSLAAVITILSLLFVPQQWIYFGAIHCLCLNSILTVPFTQMPKVALIGFILIQSYSMAFGSCPLEVPLDWPTLDVMAWFHNLGYCLLGVWLYLRWYNITVVLYRWGSMQHR